MRKQAGFTYESNGFKGATCATCRVAGLVQREVPEAKSLLRAQSHIEHRTF
jgi:hypothetical protein